MLTLNNLRKTNKWLAGLSSSLLLLGTAQAAIEDGLVAYWNFDDTYEEPVAGFYGEPRGTEPVVFVDSMAGFGKAISLDGEDQFVEIVGGSEDDLEFPYDVDVPGSGTMSISGWFRVEAFDTDWQALLSKGEGTNYRVARRGSSNNVGYAGGVGEGPDDGTDVNDMLWHHFVAVSDPDCCTRFYVDGTEISVTDAPPVLASSDLPLMIGENPGSRGREWEGEIDDIAIWNRVLTIDEITQLTTAPLGDLTTALGDTDGDTMSDIYETNHELDPLVSNVGMDTDGDGVEDVPEHDQGTHPNNPDTDGDGLGDGIETNTGIIASLADTGTDPLNADTDRDGLLDGVEANTRVFIDANNTGSNPLDNDTDGDTFNDGEEVAAGTDPNRAEGGLTVGTGLIALWEFNSDLTDSVGDHDGIYTGLGFEWFEGGKFDDGIILFNSNDDAIEAGGEESDFDRGGGSVTISAWFRVETWDTDWQALIAKGEGTNYRVARRGGTDTIAYAGGAGEPAEAAPNINDGQIHLVTAVTRAGVQTELWIDGVLYETAANPTITDNDLPLLIGGNPDADPRRTWSGLLDDVAIWSRALEPAEIQLIRNDGDGTPIANLLDVSLPPFDTIGLNFGADEADGSASGTLAPEDVAGAGDYAQANWNNLSLFDGSASALVAEADGQAQTTTVSVSWDSNNTWSSTGRGEENNAFTGADLALLTGYLDTNADTTTAVTVSGLPGLVAQQGVDVVVYALGGVAGRGGAYRIVDAWSGAPLSEYIQAQSPASPAEYVAAVGGDPEVWEEATYMVFPNITAKDLVVEATTVDPYGIGSPNRAPINAVQIVPSTGSTEPKATVAWVTFHEADDMPSADAAAAGFTEAPDVHYTKALRSAGYLVDRIITSSSPDAAVLNAYDVVIISRSVPSSDYQNEGGTAWNGITAPVIVMGGYPMRSSRMGLVTGSTLADTDRPVALAVNDPTHPVFAGIPLDGNNVMVSPFANIVTFNDIVQRGVSVTMDQPAGGGTVLATVATEDDPAANGVMIAEWMAGGTMGNDAGDTLAGHRLSFLSGSREQEITSQGAGIYDLTGTGTQMFLNAVAYMTAAAPEGEATIVGITYDAAENMVTIEYTGNALQQADAVDGEFSTIPGASNPYTFAPDQAQGFFRAANE